MLCDFNVLEKRAIELIESDRSRDAIRIYTFMADGNGSLDGGSLGRKLAQCYERLGKLHVAKYWYGRAIEEAGGPEAMPDCVAARERLEQIVTIDDLVSPQKYLVPADRAFRFTRK